MEHLYGAEYEQHLQRLPMLGPLLFHFQNVPMYSSCALPLAHEGLYDSGMVLGGATIQLKALLIA